MDTTTETIEFLDRFISAIPVGIIAFDDKGYISMLNVKAVAFLGKEGSVSEYKEQPITELIHSGKIYDKINQCLLKGRKDFDMANHAHHEKFLHVIGRKLMDGMLLSIHDVTQIVEASNKGTKLLLRGQEKERRRLAKEIHDGIGPCLSSLKLNVDLAEKKTNERDTAIKLVNISQQLSNISTEVRQISHDLMPISLIDFGLIAGLENHISKINTSTPITIKFDSDLSQAKAELSKEQELNIYRIVQEAIQNAIKHAQCSNILINIIADLDHLSLSVSDDGIGMPDSINGGIGISNIRTRVKSLRGKLVFKTEKGEGVTLSANIPINSN